MRPIERSALDRLSKLLYELIGLPQPEIHVFENPVEFKRAIKAQQQDINHSIASAFIDKIAKPTSAYLRSSNLSEKEVLNAKIQWLGSERKKALGLRSALCNSIDLNEARLSHHPHADDIGWSYFMTSLNIDTHANFNQYKKETAGIPLMSATFKQHLLALDWPKIAHFDSVERLHNEEGPAVEYESWKGYFWHGVEIPSKLIENPSSIIKSDIIQESNAEKRRCYLEILGSKAFASLIGAEVIQSEVDFQGNLQSLYRTKEKDPIAGNFIQFVNVTCPSTNRAYFLCVPPNLRTASEAVAWTFGKSQEEYHPDVET